MGKNNTKPESGKRVTPRNTQPEAQASDTNQLSLARRSHSILSSQITSLGASGSYRTTLLHRASNSDERTGRRLTRRRNGKRVGIASRSVSRHATVRARCGDNGFQGAVRPRAKELLEQMNRRRRGSRGAKTDRFELKKTDSSGVRELHVPRPRQRKMPSGTTPCIDLHRVRRHQGVTSSNRLEAGDAPAAIRAPTLRSTFSNGPTRPPKRERDQQASTPTHASIRSNPVASRRPPRRASTCKLHCSNLFPLRRAVENSSRMSSERPEIRPQVASQGRKSSAITCLYPASRRIGILQVAWVRKTETIKKRTRQPFPSHRRQAQQVDEAPGIRPEGSPIWKPRLTQPTWTKNHPCRHRGRARKRLGNVEPNFREQIDRLADTASEKSRQEYR